jgi:hypothetical protein
MIGHSSSIDDKSRERFSTLDRRAARFSVSTMACDYDSCSLPSAKSGLSYSGFAAERFMFEIEFFDDVLWQGGEVLALARPWIEEPRGERFSRFEPDLRDALDTRGAPVGRR